MAKHDRAPAPSSKEETWRRFKEASARLAEAFRPWVEGWRALRARLEAEGFRITNDPDVFPTMAPIQLEGFLPSGEAFSFRGRHETCSLRIAPPDGNPVTEPSWRHDVSRWDRFEAGCLDAEEAEAVLHELLAAYQSEQDDPAQP